MPSTRTALVAATTAVGAVLALAATPAAAIPPLPDLLRNGSFETGLSPWSCEDVEQTFRAHSGQWALEGVTSNNSTGQCTQTVAVQPNSTYLFSGFVKGRYVRLGVTGYGSAVTAPYAPQWQHLSGQFRTGPTTTTVELYVAGWYAQGRYNADDITLRGAPTGPPETPTGVTVSDTTSRGVTLTWRPSARAAGYRIYQADGRLLQDVPAPATTARVDALGAETTISVQVVAYNWSGESPRSAVVTATTTADRDSVPYAPRSVVTQAAPGASLWVAWEAVQTATDGYVVYVDGVRNRSSYGPAIVVDGLAQDRTYTIEVTARNAHGESWRSLRTFGTTLTAGAVPPPA
jgi:hypothetical protein